jgi:AcrR family transcriptional regulator
MKLWWNNMDDQTEQKFIDTSLKVFAEKGYKGATTRIIADKAGFSELTLFRKFKTKENLFNKVLEHNLIKLKKEVDLAFDANVYPDADVFLRTLITDMARIAENNYEFISLANTKKSGMTDPLRAQFVEHLSEFIHNGLPKRELDYDAFALSIFSYTFMISQTKYYEQVWFDYEKALEGFINNALKLFGEKSINMLF